MSKKYTFKILLLSVMVVLTSVITSCKKKQDAPTIKPLATLGLIEADSANYRRLYIGITKIGDVTGNYYGVFDTGSTGMTIDATGLIPANLITSNGITFTGDSLVVNNIIIKGNSTKPITMAYGDALSSTTEYGYLAYSTVTIGDQNGTITTKRIPFFLYYKVVDQLGHVYKAHSNDVFGVGPGTSYASTAIASPLSYFDMPSGVTNGFKLATISNNFISTGAFVANLLTLGLVPDDLTSAGFIMHPLSISSGGYSANIPASITYSGKTISGNILFDTGTPSVTVIEDLTAAVGSLPVNSTVTITTTQGFKYTYITTSTVNLTAVQNPNNTHDNRTIFALDFFFTNEYLTDYANHQIGLKNN